MGLFNYVDYKMNCPECGHLIDGFQTKDESIVPLYMKHVTFDQVSRFYSSCGNCGLWIEFALKRPLKTTIDDFEMTTHRYISVEEHNQNKERNKEFWRKLKEETNDIS